MTISYGAALAYLNRRANFEQMTSVPYGERTYNLDRVRHLLARSGDPQAHIPSVIIAGTKGKGSTAALIESALRAAGLRTGFYSSPHLHTFRERIRLDGQLISEQIVARLVETHLQPAVTHMEATGDPDAVPTYYELATALAFLAFAEAGVEFMVLEVGLGGRLDAVNVVDPALAVITPISYDHMAVLGNTLGAIAGEKAGIIKPGGLALSAPQSPEAAEVITRIAHERGATLYTTGNLITAGAGDGAVVRDGTGVPEGRDLHLVLAELDGTSGQPDPVHLRLPLLGAHQVANAHTAAAALLLLHDRGPALVQERLTARWDAALSSGFSAVQWPGRLEIVARDPLTVLDGAHNGASAACLRAALEEDFGVQGRQVVFVFGLNADKDGEAIVRELAPVAAHVVLTPIPSARSAPADQLAALWEPYSVPITTASSVEEALGVATRLVIGTQLICATGSLYLVGAARVAFGLSLGEDPA